MQGDNASPDDVLAKIAPYLTKISQIEIGTYVGTGTGGINNPNSLSFGFPIKVAAVFANGNESVVLKYHYRNQTDVWLLHADTLSTEWKENCGFGVITSTPKYPMGKISPDWKTIYWYHPSGENNHYYQFNAKNQTYYYFAIG